MAETVKGEIFNDLPSELVALLGASNLTFALPSVLRHLLARLEGRNVRFFVAHGPGRSYGLDAGALGVRFCGLSRCSLVSALEHTRYSSGGCHVRALLTDIGNDIMYGVSDEALLGWITSTVDRLTQLDADVAITSLPVKGLREMASWRYQLFSRIFFPNRSVPQELVVARMQRLQQALRGMANPRVKLLPIKQQWYMPDRFHIRSCKARQAFGEWLDRLLDVPGQTVLPTSDPLKVSRLSLYLHSPARLPILGRPYRSNPQGLLLSPNAELYMF